jgi:hypothetical protein
MHVYISFRFSMKDTLFLKKKKKEKNLYMHINAIYKNNKKQIRFE